MQKLCPCYQKLSKPDRIRVAAGKTDRNCVAAELELLVRSDLLFFLSFFLYADRGKCGKEVGLLLLELNKAIIGVLA